MSSPIGTVNTVYLISQDQLGNKIETNISKGMSVGSTATYAQVDQAMRALNNLTGYTYNDTNLVKTISVNEVIVEESMDPDA